VLANLLLIFAVFLKNYKGYMYMSPSEFDLHIKRGKEINVPRASQDWSTLDWKQLESDSSKLVYESMLRWSFQHNNLIKMELSRKARKYYLNNPAEKFETAYWNPVIISPVLDVMNLRRNSIYGN
jgi:hypothetical protein